MFGAGPLAKLNALMNSRLLNKTPFLSKPLDCILREFQSVISQRYRIEDPERRKQIGEIWEATLQEFRDQDTIPGPSDLTNSYHLRLFNQRLLPETDNLETARYLVRNRWPEEILERYLEPGTTVDPTNTVDVVHEVDWTTGSGNVEKSDIAIPRLLKTSIKRKAAVSEHSSLNTKRRHTVANNEETVTQ